MVPCFGFENPQKWSTMSAAFVNTGSCHRLQCAGPSHFRLPSPRIMADHIDPYMLQRDHKESNRLDTQPQMIRALCHDHLIHPSIPCQSLQAVADVGTGIGIWLQGVARDPRFAGNEAKTPEFVGFDISSQQFSRETAPGMSFVIQSIAEQLPQLYHGKFDLVQVRFLSNAIKAQDMAKVVENVLRILRQ